MLTNRSIPGCTVIPEIGYPNLREAAEWLSKAFGFSVRVRIGNHRVQMNVGDGAVVLIECAKDTQAARGFGVLVRVDDVDAHCACAKQAGAKILREPSSYPFGERQYTALDLIGNQWTFSQSIADVAPEEWGGESGTL
jgi:uncharacterized glyoxalase superfamily protein PhnB